VRSRLVEEDCGGGREPDALPEGDAEREAIGEVVLSRAPSEVVAAVQA
jgi:hypothetical protein